MKHLELYDYKYIVEIIYLAIVLFTKVIYIIKSFYYKSFQTSYLYSIISVLIVIL